MFDKNYRQDPKTRFSSRVDNYVKYRPGYPQEIIEFLTNKGILTEDSIIADIGSGTGILTELFLKNGNKVYGIEPNNEMRNAAERNLHKYDNFISVNGSAEKTSLQKTSIDIITAAQSFHWFVFEHARNEFKRILRPDGYLVVIWNNRRKTGKEFFSEYESLVVKYGTDIKEVRKNEVNIEQFFQHEKKFFYNYQDFDFEGLKGRVLSVSYLPSEGDPNYDNMLQELELLFQTYEKQGKIRLEYDTEVCYGKLE